MRAAAFLLILVALIVPAQAQQAALEKPQSAAGQAFTDHAKKRWQRTEVTYLPEGVDIAFREPLNAVDYRPSRETMQWIAIALLAVFAAAVVLTLLNNRMGGGLFSRRRRDEKLPTDEQVSPDGLFDGSREKALTAEQIMAMDDPRKGLRVLLVQALRSAAQQNGIPLRRSLTARDIVRAIPGRWPLRDPLVQLVGAAEVVLFGGSQISRDEFHGVVRAAIPLLDARERA